MDANGMAGMGRRGFLAAGVVVAASTLAPGRPAGARGLGANLVRSSRPGVTHGVQSGEVGRHEAVVWARADRPGRMIVEVAPTESFRLPRRVVGPDVGPGSDLTGKVLVRGRVYRRIGYGPSLDLFVVDMRSYRGPNSAGTQPGPGADTALLGEQQLRWLQRSLAESRATWKVICADMPLSLVVPDGATAIEAVAQGDGGAPLGREHEIAALLSSLRRDRVRNVVWLTADVHYTAAHHYDPSRASFQDFDPLWEFVSGPLNAAVQTYTGRNRLDATFGPEAVYEKCADVAGVAPSSGLQFLGEVTIDPATEAMAVTLRDRAGTAIHTVDLDP